MELQLSAMKNDDLNIPPYPRKPENGTRQATAWMIHCIDAKIAKLADLGLRPHSTLLGYRQELAAQLDAGGPYKLRVSSMML